MRLSSVRSSLKNYYAFVVTFTGIESAIENFISNGRLVYAKKEIPWLSQLNLLSLLIGPHMKRTRPLLHCTSADRNSINGFEMPYVCLSPKMASPPIPLTASGKTDIWTRILIFPKASIESLERLLEEVLIL